MNHLEFTGIWDLIEFVKTHAPKYEPMGYFSSRKPADRFFHAGATWEDTLKLAINGWPEGVEQIRKYTEVLEQKLGSSLKIDEYFYDVTGQDFDLDRVLIGEPEAWLNTEQVEVQAPALHNLKLVFNFSTSAGVDSEYIQRRGAAIVALISLLQKTRRSVEVVAGAKSMNRQTGQFFSMNVTIKKAGDSLDLDKLAFALIHPCFQRRLYFGVQEAAWEQLPVGYGKIIDLEDKGDIYIGGMNSSTHEFKSNESTEQWILEELKKQGVELKES